MFFCICTATREPEGGVDAHIKKVCSVKDGKAAFADILDGKKPQCGTCYADFMKSVKDQLGETTAASAPPQEQAFSDPACV
ncbi:MAG: hypothetical protein AB7E85_06865 [Pseudobdellovibrionaceae bacterium]